MNFTVLCGRLTRDPEIRDGNGTSVARYTLAVDRRGKKAEGEQSADFLPCVAFGKDADFAGKWLRKGMRIVVSGRLQTGSYTNRDGQKVYTTDVIISSQEFADSKTEPSDDGNPFV